MTFACFGKPTASARARCTDSSDPVNQTIRRRRCEKVPPQASEQTGTPVCGGDSLQVLEASRASGYAVIFSCAFLVRFGSHISEQDGMQGSFTAKGVRQRHQTTETQCLIPFGLEAGTRNGQAIPALWMSGLRVASSKQKERPAFMIVHG